jgi:hypothetical protein
VVVEQSFRLDKSTAGDRFILRVLGTRSTDTDGASGAASCQPRLSSSRQILRSMKIFTLWDYHCMDNALDSMSQHELLAELDAVERAIGRTAAFARRTDEVGRTRVRVSRELLALAEREYLIVAELRRRRHVQLAA